jgi:DNA modification methylase
MTILPDQHNANKGTKRGRELLEQSLKELGAGRSGLIDKDGNVIAGNKTLETAQKLGLKVRIVKSDRDELVMVQREDLDLADPTGEARRLAYLDNRVAELDLEWDAEQLAADAQAGMDFDAMGFMEGELRQLLESEEQRGRGEQDPGPQDERAEELLKKWKVEAGQVWQLGAHRLICGDVTDAAIVDRLLTPLSPTATSPHLETTNGGRERAALAFTSPPYWVGKSYEAQTSEEEIDEFIRRSAAALDQAVRRDESRIVINTGTGFTTAFDKKSKRHVLLLVDKWSNALHALGWNLRHVRHWIKEGQLMAISPKTDIIDQHNEFLVTFEHADGVDRKFDDVLGEGDVSLILTFYQRQGKQRGGEWTGEKWALRSFWDDIRGTARECGHEAAFPVELPLRHLLLYTKRGEMVFEPFCGSGTTIVACEVLKRVCLAAELEPKYVAATLERWVMMTGLQPTPLAFGHPPISNPEMGGEEAG